MAALVLVIEAAAVPIVAEGTAPLTPFWAMAVSESAAKPMDAGLYRNTEYTFFCATRERASSTGARGRVEKTSDIETYQERVPDDPCWRLTRRRRRTRIKKGADTLARAELSVLEVGRTHRPGVAAKGDRDRHRRATCCGGV